MNMMTTLERNPFSLRPEVFRQPKTGWKTRPKHDKKSPDALNPVGMVNTKEFPWCLPWNEAHSDDAYPRQTKKECSGFAN